MIVAYRIPKELAAVDRISMALLEDQPAQVHAMDKKINTTLLNIFRNYTGYHNRGLFRGWRTQEFPTPEPVSPP